MSVNALHPSLQFPLHARCRPDVAFILHVARHFFWRAHYEIRPQDLRFSRSGFSRFAPRRRRRASPRRASRLAASVAWSQARRSSRSRAPRSLRSTSRQARATKPRRALTAAIRSRPCASAVPTPFRSCTPAAAAAAFAPKTVENININLGVISDVNVSVEAITVAEKSRSHGRQRSGLRLDEDRRGDFRRARRDRDPPDDLGTTRVDHAADAAGERDFVRRPGQPPQQHHGRRLVLQQLLRSRLSARRAHQRRADLARVPRAGAGEHCAVRRAPGQLHRRRDQQRHAQRHEPVHRVASITGCAARISSARRRAA